MEERLQLPDGLHTYLSVKFPIYSVEGAPEGLCGISTNITEKLKKAQEQLRLLSGSIMAGQEKREPPLPGNCMMNWGRYSPLCAWMPSG